LRGNFGAQPPVVKTFLQNPPLKFLKGGLFKPPQKKKGGLNKYPPPRRHRGRNLESPKKEFPGGPRKKGRKEKKMSLPREKIQKPTNYTPQTPKMS